MARKPGNYGDSDRDGFDDDIDQRPGNSSDSAEYARRYDYGSTKEYTSSDLDRADQIQIAQIRRENESRGMRERTSGRQRIFYWPKVGEFCVPSENTWAAHVELIKDPKNELHFDPEKYEVFDKIIAEKAGIPALYDKNHPDYARYNGLRTNLEVLRNDIMGIYMNDGSYDKGDEIYVPQLESIAKALAEALARDKWFNRLMGYQTVNLDIANIEGVGAAAMYEHLLSVQQKPAPMQALRDRLNKFFGLPEDKIWQLPPMEETPYSPEALSAPPPRSKEQQALDEIEQLRQQQQQQEVTDPNKEMSDLAEQIVTPDPKMSVEQMEEAAKDESVEEARKILRNLRNMEFGDRDMEEYMDMGTPKAQVAKAAQLHKLVHIHQLQMQLAEARNPELRNDMFVQDGKFAASAIRLATAEYALRNLPKDHPQAAKLEQLIFSMPEQAHARQNQSLERLLDNVSTGLERATGKQVYERSPADRLISASNRIQKAARKMRSIDTLEPPARQESLELAHDILRRLKEMEISRKPLSEFIETSRPEEKAAVAQKIDEVVDMYKNLVSEAATINPALMQDVRIQEGVDAVDEFAHTVKLMASKEVPNSIASAQQIGADVTQDPEEWNKLHDRTIERIVTSMEGGLEEAIDTIEVQEQAAEQAEEEARDQAIESAMHQHSIAGRKKRKRWAWSRSGAGGKRSEKVSQDLRADDRAAGQGRFNEDRDRDRNTPSTATRPNSVTMNAAAQQDKSGMNQQQKTSMNLNADDRLKGEGRFRDQEPEQQNRRQTTNASRNTRTGRSARRIEAEQQQARRDDRDRAREAARSQRAGEREQRATERDQQGSRRTNVNEARDPNRPSSQGTGQNAGNMSGNSSRSNNPNRPSGPVSIPEGMNPQALAALQQALKQEGNTLLNMNNQVRDIKNDGGSSPARGGDAADREQQQRQTNNRNNRGNERI